MTFGRRLDLIILLSASNFCICASFRLCDGFRVSFIHNSQWRCSRGVSTAISERVDVRLKCAAAVLTVSSDPVCDEDDVQDAISSDPYRGAGSPEEHDDKETFIGEIVLSDWLDELPVTSLSRANVGNRGVKDDQIVIGGGPRQRCVGDQEKNAALDRSECAPVRFQHLIQRMWAELNRDDQLLYLGAQGQARVKAALTVLAAYCALREHPLQAGVNSPQQAFSEMDFNRDGEVTFDEFVRWYSMSTTNVQEEENMSGGSVAVEGSCATTALHDAADAPPIGTVSTRVDELSTPLKSTTPAGDGASRLIVDLEKLTLVDRGRGLVSSAPGDGLDVRSAASETTATVGIGSGVTEAQKEAAREQWLAGGRDESYLDPVPPGFSVVSNGEASPAEDLEKALELLCVLVNANADADTLIAALASCIIHNPMGRYNLDVIEEQFGPIIRGIVEERLLLERLPEPTSAESYVAIRQSRGIKPVLDLDDHHAKLMRDYLVRLSKDCRAVVVHMADLTCRLRESNDIPAYARHSLALEALQLFVPVSNALGLGASFRELEELAYKSLFPLAYSETAQWHHDVKGKSHDIVVDVKKRMLEALESRKHLASRVRGYRVDGRMKGLVSTFRKVFRQNKRATNVHDIIGFRIIVSPKSHVPGAPRSSSTAGSKDRLPSSAADGPGDHGQVDGVKKADLEEEVRVEEDVMGSGRWPEHTSSRSVFTVKTFPPPYRDLDSRLLHQVYEVLVGLYEEVPGRYKNYVDFPKANGYRSLHTTVMHPSGLMMEFQVRTAEMDTEAEGGAAAHSLYKGNLENPVDASIFRSKMALDMWKPAQNGLPSIASRHRKAFTEAKVAATVSSKKSHLPLRDNEK